MGRFVRRPPPPPAGGRGVRRLLPLAVTAALVFGLAACDLFDTDKDEDGSGLIKAAAPVADPPPGYVLAGTTVHFTSATEGARVYLSSTGALPELDSKGDAVITQDITILAFARAPEGYEDSDEVSFEYKVKTYTITLDPQGGSGGTASVTAAEGGAMPAITVPTKEDYLFGGYYAETGGKGTQYYTADGTSAHNWDKASGATLYARWMSTFNLSTGTGAGEGWDYYDDWGWCLDIHDGADVTVSGSTTTDRIVVQGTATVTLDGVTIAESGDNPAFRVGEGAKATLRLKGVNTLTGNNGKAGVHVPQGAEIYITSADGDGSVNGTLYATGSLFKNGDYDWACGAGIGENGGWGEGAGTITIAGGTIYATGGSGTCPAAGIGGGNGANGFFSGGVIRITGGRGTATGGSFNDGVNEGFAPGIGGGGGEFWLYGEKQAGWPAENPYEWGN